MNVLITGASGFIGGAIVDRLVDRASVRSLTHHPGKNRFGERVRSFLYDFDRAGGMAEAFAGVDIFINSYYVRFNYGTATFERAVEHSRTLIAAARTAGVRKLVHVSVSNADERSDLPYYRNKGLIERLVADSRIEHTILRPALVVGHGDILVNNIAYFLRHLPLFTIFGHGEYRTQPMMLEAFADLVVEVVDGGYPNLTLPVAGPADWSFLELVRAVRRAVGSRARLVPAPPWMALAGLKVAGLLLGDVVLTRDEIRGLMRECLYAEDPIRRGPDLADWLALDQVASTLGRQYASELARRT